MKQDKKFTPQDKPETSGDKTPEDNEIERLQRQQQIEVLKAGFAPDF